ncbi:MAG TPA: hypothetical protein VMD09_06990 [Solirubrobacteraceae bacterium]|nr:hypothetical protein [Solirubrobacteraceae bacterium]
MGEASPSRLILGQLATCVDGPFGALEDIVIDPSSKRVTHIVVRPHGSIGSSRLVPFGFVRTGSAVSQLSLQCTLSSLRELPAVEDLVSFPMDPPGDQPGWDVGIKDTWANAPYEAGALIDFRPEPSSGIVIAFHRVPKGKIEIRHASAVSTTDGHDAGRLHGVVLSGPAITHLLLRRGHRFWRREYAVPAGAIEELASDSVVVSLSRHQIKALPAA